MICEICKENKNIRFRDKVHICSSCRDKITKELPIEISKSESDIFFKRHKIIESYENKIGSKYCKIEYKGLTFNYYQCQNCLCWFLKLDHPLRPLSQIEENQNLQLSCSNFCQLKLVHKSHTQSGICKMCGKKVDKRDVIGYGIDCGCSKDHANQLQKINSGPGFCTNANCGKWNEYRTTAGLGIECGCAKSLAKRIRVDLHGPGYCTICNKWSDNRSGTGLCFECQSKISINICKDKYCEICKTITPHNGSVCTICHPESTRGGPGTGVLNFKEIDGILYYLDLNSNEKDYIPWEDYKNKFSVLNIDFQLPDDFQLIPTFRIQDSENWSGASKAFEQNLVDLGIGWFVYIKFYIDSKGNIYPLVVGKSGSLLVNRSGSDVSFSTDINDGPARRFINETKGISWYKTHIAILSCENEQDAYENEKYWMKKLNCFGS